MTGETFGSRTTGLEHQVLERHPKVVPESYLPAEGFLVEYPRLRFAGGQCDTRHHREREEVPDVLESPLYQAAGMTVTT